jgi:hypothetical protein
VSLGGVEVVRDFVPEIDEVRASIHAMGLSQESNRHHVLGSLGSEVALVKHEIVRDHRIVVNVHDIFTVMRKPMTARPQGPSLVSL